MNYKPIIQKYITETINGKLLMGKLARLRVERHINDLARQHDNGMYFDEKAATKVLRFFTFLKHAKGSQFAGKQFELSPWQAFDVYCIFGWKTSSGNRRFKYAYTDIARKNGKTTYAAALALYLLMMDQEPGAEIYTVATKREQARICLDDARTIVKNSRDLIKYAQVWQHAVTCEAMGATMKALASDSNTLDGLNPHGVILDEFHAHRDDMVFNVMKSAMGARQQPLMILLTTAGFNRNVPCYAYRDVGIKVLEGVLQQDDSYYSIHTLDKDDDYHLEETWIKSNPNLDISVSSEFLRDEYKAAKNNPSQLYNFLTKNLNIWTDSAEAWFEQEQWNACNKGVEDLDNAECYGGLDLASVRDTTALALRFHKPNGQSTYKTFYWMPEMNVEERVKNKGINYDQWIRSGYMRITPGNVADYDFVKRDILQLCKAYKIKRIAYDRWNSSQFVLDLIGEGLEMSPFGQGYGSMSAPTKEFEKEVLTGRMNHEGNPVLSWHVSNVYLQRDPAGNVKIDKSKSSEKVDGAVACVMALGEYMTAMGSDTTLLPNDIYSSQNVKFV